MIIPHRPRKYRRLIYYRDFVHDYRLYGFIGKIHVNFRDFIYYVHSLYDFAESGILTVEMRRVLMHDKELRTRGIRVHRSCHGNNAAQMLYVVCHAVCGKLALFYRPRRPSGSLGQPPVYKSVD